MCAIRIYDDSVSCQPLQFVDQTPEQQLLVRRASVNKVQAQPSESIFYPLSTNLYRLLQSCLQEGHFAIEIDLTKLQILVKNFRNMNQKTKLTNSFSQKHVFCLCKGTRGSDFVIIQFTNCWEIEIKSQKRWHNVQKMPQGSTFIYSTHQKFPRVHLFKSAENCNQQ